MAFQPAGNAGSIVQATSTAAAATAIPAGAKDATHAIVTNLSSTATEHVSIGFGVGDTAAIAAGTYAAGGSYFIVPPGKSYSIPVPRGSTYFSFDSASGTPNISVCFGWDR